MRRDWNNGKLECWNVEKRPASTVWKFFDQKLQCLEKFVSDFPRFGKKVSRGWKSIIPAFHHSPIPARKAGLSLIEVMLAIVILGVGSGVLMLATGRCLAVISKARHYSTAHRLILRVEAEHPIPRGEIDAETESGDFDDEDYTWEREITEEDDENRPGLYTVRTRVSWAARGKASFEEVVTWRYVEPKEPKVF